MNKITNEIYKGKLLVTRWNELKHFLQQFTIFQSTFSTDPSPSLIGFSKALVNLVKLLFYY